MSLGSASSSDSPYGRDPYCKEELIAETGAAFLCAHAEIVEVTIRNSAAYIDGWLKRLSKDKTLVVHAAAQAQRAANFIIDSPVTETEGESWEPTKADRHRNPARR
jgi:antirestriction protein ArdC